LELGYWEGVCATGGKKWDWILGDRIESFASNKIQQEEKRPIKGTPM
jgi:hypothetical protein